MAGLVLSFEQLAAAARTASGPLAPPLAPTAPFDPLTGRELVQVLVSDMNRRFATGTAPDGTPWKPLRYNRPAGGNQPLRSTGALMASITGRHTADEVIVGTNHPGARLHNFGGRVVPRKGKFLAIALSATAVRAGSPRTMRGTKAMPLFARPCNGRLVGHFLLVKEVNVSRREFLGVSEQGFRVAALVLFDRAARNWTGNG